MAEYIDKEAAIKAVSENDYEGYATIAVKAIHAADVAPVVRCRECIHWNTGTNEAESWEYCILHDHLTDEDMFCSWGERKDGADNG